MKQPTYLADVGCVHGRFQPPHLDHLEYIIEAKKRVRKLLIGVTQPDTDALERCDVSPHRQSRSSNPLTYIERCLAIELMLEAEGFKRSEYDFEKFPIDKPEELVKVLPRSVLCLTTIRDNWNLHKLSVLEDLGYKVHVLWDRRDKPGIAGTIIRRKIHEGMDDWQQFVHPAVANYLLASGILARIRAAPQVFE